LVIWVFMANMAMAKARMRAMMRMMRMVSMG
jgi:hypothetical protein